MTQESTRTVGKSEQSVTPKACFVMLVQCRNGNQNQNSRQMLVAVRGVATTTVSPFGSMWTHRIPFIPSWCQYRSFYEARHVMHAYHAHKWFVPDEILTRYTPQPHRDYRKYDPAHELRTQRFFNDLSLGFPGQQSGGKNHACLNISPLCRVFCGVKPCEDWPGKRKKEKTFPASRTFLSGLSPEWGGTTRSLYTDVLVVREINCGSWLARKYMPALQKCGLFIPLDCGEVQGLS